MRVDREVDREVVLRVILRRLSYILKPMGNQLGVLSGEDLSIERSLGVQ